MRRSPKIFNLNEKLREDKKRPRPVLSGSDEPIVVKKLKPEEKKSQR